MTRTKEKEPGPVQEKDIDHNITSHQVVPCGPYTPIVAKRKIDMTARTYSDTVYIRWLPSCLFIYRDVETYLGSACLETT